MAIPSYPFPHLSVLFPFKFICRFELSTGPQPGISLVQAGLQQTVQQNPVLTASQRGRVVAHATQNLALNQIQRLRAGKTSSLDSLSPPQIQTRGGAYPNQYPHPKHSTVGLQVGKTQKDMECSLSPNGDSRAGSYTPFFPDPSRENTQLMEEGTVLNLDPSFPYYSRKRRA